MRQQPARPPKKKKMRVMDLVIRAPKGEGGGACFDVVRLHMSDWVDHRRLKRKGEGQRQHRRPKFNRVATHLTHATERLLTGYKVVRLGSVRSTLAVSATMQPRHRL